VTLGRGGPKASDAARFARLDCYSFGSKDLNRAPQAAQLFTLFHPRRHLCRYRQTDAMKDKSKTFTWEWEDGETGLIRTIKIPMPNLDCDYDPSESREIILDRKPRLDKVEMPDWIEIIPPRKPN
jgi:hypothetical protein